MEGIDTEALLQEFMEENNGKNTITSFISLFVLILGNHTCDLLLDIGSDRAFAFSVYVLLLSLL